MLNETTGAFDGARNPRPPHYESDMQPTAPCRPLIYFLVIAIDSNPPITQFSSPCNVFKSLRLMSSCYTVKHCAEEHTVFSNVAMCTRFQSLNKNLFFPKIDLHIRLSKVIVLYIYYNYQLLYIYI